MAERIQVVVVDGKALLEAQEHIRTVGNALADLRNHPTTAPELLGAVDALLQISALFVSVEIDRRKSALHLSGGRLQ